MKLVISTMKNEGPFLLEWIAYHRAIGFDQFLIYTNDCTDGTDFLLDRLDALGVVQHRRNQVLRRGPHKSALKHALSDPAVAAAEWIFVADADEFLNVTAGKGMVDDLIAAFPDADAIPVTWRLFSSGGATEFPVPSVLTAFTDAEPDTPGAEPKRFVKSLFRRDDRIQKFGLHAPDYDPEAPAPVWGSAWVAAAPEAEPRRPDGIYGYDTAQVNHYAVRSVDAFLLKRDRGRANHVGGDIGLDYWIRWNRGGMPDSSIQRHVRATRRQLKALREDPETAFLERASVALSRERLRELLDDPAWAALRAELIGGTGGGGSPVAEANARMRRKSPRRHRNRQKLLDRMPKGGRCAEIGVWAGGFTVEILQITKPSELVLIDPWGLLADEAETEWVHSKNSDGGFMDEMHDNVVAAFADEAAVKVRKGFSADVLADYPDDYFDWVYIDGNHLYDYVRQDVELCYRKVRAGGVIAGDDFLWKREGRLHVKDAVEDAMGQVGLDPATHLEVLGQQFTIRVAKDRVMDRVGEDRAGEGRVAEG